LHVLQLSLHSDSFISPSPIWHGDVADNIIMAIAYIAGTAFSALAGKIGIEVATIANIKSAEAAKKA